MEAASMRKKIEEAVRELFKLHDSVNNIFEALKKVNETKNMDDLDQSMKSYRKAKENLLKSGKVKLSDQKLLKIWEEYEAIRELKKEEQIKILDKVFVIKESSNLMVDAFIADTKEFVRMQEEVLTNFDLKPLEEIVQQEKRFYANASEKIKKDTRLFNRLQETLKDHDVKVKICTEHDDSSESTKNVPVKESSVVLYNMLEFKNTDDCSLVRRFLVSLNFGEPNIVSIERIEQNVKGSSRPLKVTFGNEEIVEKLLEVPIGKAKFDGRYIRIGKTQR